MIFEIYTKFLFFKIFIHFKMTDMTFHKKHNGSNHLQLLHKLQKLTNFPIDIWCVLQRKGLIGCSAYVLRKITVFLIFPYFCLYPISFHLPKMKVSYHEFLGVQGGGTLSNTRQGIRSNISKVEGRSPGLSRFSNFLKS